MELGWITPQQHTEKNARMRDQWQTDSQNQNKITTAIINGRIDVAGKSEKRKERSTMYDDANYVKEKKNYKIRSRNGKNENQNK